ncbi:hypothetical protein HDU67_005915 [Dinochytrium kinnereticum]|nr:hypothetical protein HDU67_005915 [Dinochytrium kinnereticum]
MTFCRDLSQKPPVPISVDAERNPPLNSRGSPLTPPAGPQQKSLFRPSTRTMSAFMAMQPPGLLVMASAGALTLFISLGVRSVTGEDAAISSTPLRLTQHSVTRGLFIVPVSIDLGWGRGVLSLAIAALNMAWGITNPFICAWADTHGTGPIIFLGGLLYATGLALLALAGTNSITPPIVIIGVGVLMGTATAATGISIVLALLGKTFYSVRGADDRVRLIVFGIVSAVSQMGQFVLAPVCQALIKSSGWRVSVWMLCGLSLVLLPMAIFLREKKSVKRAEVEEEVVSGETTVAEPGKSDEGPSTFAAADSIADSENILLKERDIKVLTALDRAGTQIVVPIDPTSSTDTKKDTGTFLASKELTAVASELDTEAAQQIIDDGEPRSVREAIQEALTSRPFLMISSAFFVCGWHIGFIGTHIPGVAEDNGVSPTTASWTISLIGATSTIGTGLAGYLPRFFRVKVKTVLTLVYLYRAIMISAFILILRYVVDKKNPSAASGVTLAFSFLIGFAWLTTVPLTTALVSNIYGTKYLGTLSAITFLGHQIGSFLGSYLGGLEYDRSPDASMTGCWWASVALGVFAGTMHFLADDCPPVRKRVVVGAGVVPGDTEVRREHGKAP